MINSVLRICTYVCVGVDQHSQYMQGFIHTYIQNLKYEGVREIYEVRYIWVNYFEGRGEFQ